MTRPEFVKLCRELRDKVETSANGVVGIDVQLAESLYENEAEFNIRVKFAREQNDPPVFVNKGTR